MIGIALALAISATRLPPTDQCIADQSFVQFRSELQRTVARRDSAALLRLVADDVYASFGGHIGKADFIDLWDLRKQPEHSRIWRELGGALKLGCAIQGDARVAPSFDAQVDPARDPFETRVALPGAVLRQGPNDGSRSLATLDWHLLTLTEAWEGGPWVHVRLDDGRSGYVREAMARSVIGYRAAFEQRGGKWLMTSFVAGD